MSDLVELMFIGNYRHVQNFKKISITVSLSK